MKVLARLLAAACLAAAASCSEPLDPATADLVGTVVAVDAANNRLGVRSDNQYLFVPLPVDFDYSVSVGGQVLAQTAGGFRRISIRDVQVSQRIAIWTTGVELRSLPAQVQATRVVVVLASGAD